jgi:hypothetical protein
MGRGSRSTFNPVRLPVSKAWMSIPFWGGGGEMLSAHGLVDDLFRLVTDDR